ncbi:MAG: lipoyl synthase [bacterium]
MVRKPPWLRRRLPKGGAFEQVRGLIHAGRVHTVCQEAQCPNMWECFSRHTATFLIMGPRCTRRCRFCAVEHGPSGPPDTEEPARVAEMVKRMGLHYVVITSVTRDDLPDGGTGLFAATIEAIRGRVPDALVEVLIPDLQGSIDALRTVLDARPAVLNHNIETVPRLYPLVRPGADYHRSIEIFRNAGAYAPGIPLKSGLMLGLGESGEEVKETLGDLRAAGCSILTLGQYLQPTRDHLPVERFVPPEEFDRWKGIALGMGFSDAASGPFVRSSYRARDLYRNAQGEALSTNAH